MKSVTIRNKKNNEVLVKIVQLTGKKAGQYNIKVLSDIVNNIDIDIRDDNGKPIMMSNSWEVEK